MNFVGRKPVFNSEVLAEIAARRLAGVKCEPRASGDHDDGSTNRKWLKLEFSFHTTAMEGGRIAITAIIHCRLGRLPLEVKCRDRPFANCGMVIDHEYAYTLTTFHRASSFRWEQ